MAGMEVRTPTSPTASPASTAPVAPGSPVIVTNHLATITSANGPKERSTTPPSCALRGDETTSSTPCSPTESSTASPHRHRRSRPQLELATNRDKTVDYPQKDPPYSPVVQSGHLSGAIATPRAAERARALTELNKLLVGLLAVGLLAEPRPAPRRTRCCWSRVGADASKAIRRDRHSRRRAHTGTQDTRTRILAPARNR